MDLTYMQPSPRGSAAFAGRVYGSTPTPNDFAHNYRTQFLNMGLNINLAAAPGAHLGVGRRARASVPWKDALMTVSVLDPDGTPVDNSLAGAFSSGVLVAGPRGRVTIRPFGLAGHQLVGGYWSNKERLRIDQDPSNIALFLAESRFPRLNDRARCSDASSSDSSRSCSCPCSRSKTKDYTWTVYYNFDQYLWNPGQR